MLAQKEEERLAIVEQRELVEKLKEENKMQKLAFETEKEQLL